MKGTLADRLFATILGMMTGIIVLITVYPLWYVLIASVSSPMEILSGNVLLLPKGIQFEAFVRVFRDGSVLTGYQNTIMYTLVGTSANLLMTILAAFPLSRRDFVGRGAFMGLMTFTMFFSGGMIPTYLLIKQLKLLNSFWVMVLPGLVSCWNVVIMRTFFQHSIPFELQEAALIDGCGNARMLCAVVLPLSAPIVAVTVMYYAVGHWNSFFNALIYLTDAAKYPLQIVLRSILLQNDVGRMAETGVESEADRVLIIESLRFAIIIVSTLPMLMLYPFIQRYFVKGVMVGALKG